MNELDLWFEEEFGHLGFMIGQTIYDPMDFTPRKSILWKRPDGSVVRTRLVFTPEMANDLISWTQFDPVEEYRSLLRTHINQFLELEGYVKDFKPKRKINKLKL